MPKQETETQKSIKAIEAAVRKARRAGIEIKVTYTVTDEDGSTRTERIGNL